MCLSLYCMNWRTYLAMEMCVAILYVLTTLSYNVIHDGSGVLRSSSETKHAPMFS